MIELWMLILVGVIVFMLVLGALFFWGLKHAIALALNSIIGFFALYAVKVFWLTQLDLNIWSVGIVALTGLLGFIVVLVAYGVGFFHIPLPPLPPVAP